MFNYSVKPGEQFKLNTPGVNSLDEIKKEFKQTTECIINHSIYPTGLDITFTQLADKIIISSNKELIRNEDGSYSVQE